MCGTQHSRVNSGLETFPVALIVPGPVSSMYGKLVIIYDTVQYITNHCIRRNVQREPSCFLRHARALRDKRRAGTLYYCTTVRYVRKRSISIHSAHTFEKMFILRRSLDHS